MSEEREELTQTEAAARLTITTRQLRRIPDEFTGRLKSGKYPWPECQKGYIRFKQQDELRRRGHSETRASEYEAARARKVAAQARLAELEVALRESELIPIAVFREVIAEVADRVMGFLKNIPGAWPPQLTSIDDPREIARILRGLVDEAAEEVRGVVDELLDPEDQDARPDAA